MPHNKIMSIISNTTNRSYYTTLNMYCTTKRGRKVDKGGYFFSSNEIPDLLKTHAVKNHRYVSKILLNVSKRGISQSIRYGSSNDTTMRYVVVCNFQRQSKSLDHQSSHLLSHFLSHFLLLFLILSIQLLSTSQCNQCSTVDMIITTRIRVR